MYYGTRRDVQNLQQYIVAGNKRGSHTVMWRLWSSDAMQAAVPVNVRVQNSMSGKF